MIRGITLSCYWHKHRFPGIVDPVEHIDHSQRCYPESYLDRHIYLITESVAFVMCGVTYYCVPRMPLYME